MNKSVLALGVLLVTGAVVLAPLTSEAQIKKSGTKYSLRMKWAKGQKFGYNIEMAQVGKGAQPMKMGVDYNVKSIKGTTGNVDVKVSGMGGEPQTESVTIDDRGRVTGGKNSGFTNILEYPSEAIAVGGSWNTKASLPGMAGGAMTGTAKNTLKGFKTIDGKQYAHIYTDLKTTGGGMTGNGKTDTLISMGDGQIFRTTMSLKLSITTKDSKGKPTTQSIDMAIKMNRK